jgi:hypothetical protein
VEEERDRVTEEWREESSKSRNGVRADERNARG